MPPRRVRALKQDDEYPQWYGMSVIPTAAGTTETFPLRLPVSRLQAGGSTTTSVVIEILGVNWKAPGPPPIANPAESQNNWRAFLTTRDHGIAVPELDELDIIDWFALEYQGAFSALGTYATLHEENRYHDLTDKDGHGCLVAVDAIYLQLSGSATFAVACQFRILYRFRRIALAEYIGMIQSQM